jgi:hypothetical protein
MDQDEHRLLELLAESPNGATDALLLTQGFTSDLLVRLVRVRRVRAKRERTFAGGWEVQITRVTITESGRRVLAKRQVGSG